MKNFEGGNDQERTPDYGHVDMQKNSISGDEVSSYIHRWLEQKSSGVQYDSAKAKYENTANRLRQALTESSGSGETVRDLLDRALIDPNLSEQDLGAIKELLAMLPKEVLLSVTEQEDGDVEGSPQVERMRDPDLLAAIGYRLFEHADNAKRSMDRMLELGVIRYEGSVVRQTEKDIALGTENPTSSDLNNYIQRLGDLVGSYQNLRYASSDVSKLEIANSLLLSTRLEYENMMDYVKAFVGWYREQGDDLETQEGWGGIVSLMDKLETNSNALQFVKEAA